MLELTLRQAAALEAELANLGQVKCFIAMRYWHPMVLEAAERVSEFGADKIVLLPLYPQFSSTTTASSLDAWDCASLLAGITKKPHTVCCYPDEAGWIAAQVELIIKTRGERANREAS